MSAIGTALERLSPRDRALLVVLVGVVFVGGTALSWQVVSGKHKARERRLETNRTHLETLYAGRETYLKRQAKLRERKNILRIQPPQLRRYLEGVARNVGVTIDDLKDRPVPPPAKPSDIEEVSMEARLTNVAYDKIVKLFAEVESSQAVVLIRELRLDYKGDNTFREVRFTVSTFHLKGGGEAGSPASASPPAPVGAPRGGPPKPPGAAAPGVTAPGANAPAANVPGAAKAAPTVTPLPSVPPPPPASGAPPAVSPAGAGLPGAGLPGASPSPLRIPSPLRRNAVVQPRPGAIAPPSLFAPRIEPPVPVKLPAPRPTPRGTR